MKTHYRINRYSEKEYTTEKFATFTSGAEAYNVANALNKKHKGKYVYTVHEICEINPTSVGTAVIRVSH